MEKQFQYTIGKFGDEIIQKTRFSLENYDRYRKNLEKPQKPNFSSGEELKLLLIQPPEDFKEGLRNIYLNLDELRAKLLNEFR